jgi:carbonic anhydrase/acetyltransferase-like protein (isoleucine patch superfamily)
MAIYRLEDDVPRLAAGAWVAETATVIGRVELGADSSVWHGAVLRGDNEWIRIGACSNVQDGSVLHTDPGFEMRIGERVSIGHQVMLHGCTIGDGSLVGIQAIVLNGAKIGRGCLVAAGAVVTEGKVFPDHSLILGAPAKVVREISPEQLAGIERAATSYVAKAARYRTGLVRIG